MPPGLEQLAAGELDALGLGTELDTGGVTFRASARELYQANLHSRVASRILVRVAGFRATAFWELEKRAGVIPWGDLVTPGRAVTFRVTSKKSKLYHQEGIAERLGSALVGAMAGVTVDDADGAQEFVVRVFRDRVTVSIDSSGALLHQRGYRLAAAKAPLRENLGAALIMAAGWDTTRPLLDPFAGSGTMPIEAALIARRIPPGWQRRFGFEEWPAFDEPAWRAVRAEAESRMLPRAPAPIHGSDRDAGAIESATANALRAGVAGDIEWRRAAVSEAATPEPAGWIVSNPPYGIRVSEGKQLGDLFARLGQLARERYRHWTIALLAADPRLTAATGLVLEEALRFRNGGIPVRLMVRRSGVSS
ncbi:MAG TPA: THUMP domain-containing protein [Gemmatimonadales bacterium]|nr:THUMP domain-containing protein [Gemmatimonadales bacterium]